MPTRKFQIVAVNDKVNPLDAIIYTDKVGKITGSSHPYAWIHPNVQLKKLVGSTVWHVKTKYPYCGMFELPQIRSFKLPKNETSPNPVV